MAGRMRLVSDQTVIAAAMRVEDVIIETYLGQTAAFENWSTMPTRAA
jgi:hypothetical protein